MQLISLDFEVYKYDWLAGFKLYQTGEYFQFHNDREALMSFINKYKDAIYFTINGYNYDENILDAILKGLDPYPVSKGIIVHRQNPLVWNLPIITYDLQFTGRGKKAPDGPSLKVFESNNGMSIEELPISATYEDPLNEEQMEILKKYNRHDLDATEVYMLQRFNESFMVKSNLISYFGLEFKKWIGRTPQSILCEGLGAVAGTFTHQAFTFENQFHTLQLKNETVREWLETEAFYDKPLKIDICGIPHVLAKGGIHGATADFYRAKNVWHIDFSSFYPTLMLEYDLLSRALVGNNGKEKFLKLRSDRFIAKKNKDPKDPALKIGLNSVFGAADNEYLSLYDPSRSRLTCMYGQAYTIDLLEKLEPYIDLIQSNTDGIIFELKEKTPEYEKIMRDIVEEFIARTGLGAEIDHMDFIAQRDVNNYVGLDHGKEVLIGNAASSSLKPAKAFYRGRYRVFQTQIITRAMYKYLLYKTPIEETVAGAVVDEDWIAFQATSKTGSQFHKVMLHEVNTEVFENIKRINLLLKDKRVKELFKECDIKRVTSYNTFLKKLTSDEFTDEQLELLEMLEVTYQDVEGISYEVQHINRVFASNDSKVNIKLKKYKYNQDDEEASGLVTSLPENLFIFNKDLREFGEKEIKKLDLAWYINKAYREVYVFITGDKKTKDEDIIKNVVDSYTLED